VSTRPIESGELPRRLARSHGLYGQDHYQLDETVIPVSILEDASILPFARSPYKVGKYTSKVGNATNSPTSAIRNEVASGGQGILLLDQLIISSSVANRIEVDKYGTLDGAPVSAGNLLDLSTPIGGAGAPKTVPVIVYNYADVVVVNGFPGSSLGVFRVPAATGIVIPLGFPLYPQEVLYIVGTGAVAGTLEMCWLGRWFPEVTA
jgi:hypothetical protein